jgi:hypothetical protein
MILIHVSTTKSFEIRQKRLTDEIDVANQVMLFSEYINRLDLPDISIDLADVFVALHTTIPAFVQVVGVEDLVAPAVKNPKLVAFRINANTNRHEDFINSIVVGSKRIRNKNGNIRINADLLVGGICTAVGTFNRQCYLVAGCFGISEGRIL